MHFTGKERDDAESGLDYLGARYHASTMGRFMTPDPKMPSLKHLLNPQKWNKYAYTLNNPLKYFDPDGLEEMVFQLRAVIQQQSVSDPLGRRFAGFCFRPRLVRNSRDNSLFGGFNRALSPSAMKAMRETIPDLRDS